MHEKQIETLIDAIEDVVKAAGTWTEKRTAILDYMTEEQKSALEEFVAWFEEGVDE
jgi:hypothetical protein